MSVQSVILLTPSFPADEHDRNCLPTLQLFVVELLQQNIEVHIIALDYPFSEEPYQWQGASVYPCGGRNSRWLKPRTIWRTYQRCCQLLDEKSAKSGAPGKTCLHSFWLGWASGIGEYVAKRRNLRHITTLMGQDVLLQNRHRFRFLSTERQKRLVALSDYQNEVFEKNAGFRAASVIPWGVSTAEIPSHIPDNRPIDVLGVGSFIPLKNWALWLETIALVAKTKPDLRAELIGSGPEKPRLELLAAQLGLTKILRFSGDLPRSAVLQKMQQAKILFHSSNYESQGYVLAEAAMCACRIVATPVGIAPLMGECATTIPGLATKILIALEQPCLTSAKIPFLMSDTARDYLELYNATTASV
jgi:glycosyltransferase involved in cell wall biosynthesis